MARDLLIYGKLFIRLISSTFSDTFCMGACHYVTGMFFYPVHTIFWRDAHVLFQQCSYIICHLWHSDYQVRSQFISLTLHAWRLGHFMLTGMIFSALLLFQTHRPRTPTTILTAVENAFLLTGCSTTGVIGLSTSTHLRSYMEHLSHKRAHYLCQGLICTIVSLGASFMCPLTPETLPSSTLDMDYNCEFQSWEWSPQRFLTLYGLLLPLRR